MKGGGRRGGRVGGGGGGGGGGGDDCDGVQYHHDIIPSRTRHSIAISITIAITANQHHQCQQSSITNAMLFVIPTSTILFTIVGSIIHHQQTALSPPLRARVFFSPELAY